jgi:DNA adenine methylase
VAKFIKSPLRYPGGKSRAVKIITPLIPQFSEFREPFVGGGSIFLQLKQSYPQNRFWINDLYTELSNFWQQAQVDVSGMVAQIIHWKTQFIDGKTLYQFLLDNFSRFNMLEKASAFFIFNRITFSGTTEAGGFSEQAFQKRFTLSSIKRLAELKAVLPQTIITNIDYSALVSAPGKDVFIFLDPPYFSATKSALYGKRGTLHKNFDHQRFAEVMRTCEHRWLITYDDSSYIRELFGFANIYEWNLMYGMRNQTPQSRQLGNELIIANYSLNKLKLLDFENSMEQQKICY